MDEGVARLHISDLASLYPFPLADSFSHRHPPTVNPGKRIISQPPLPNAKLFECSFEERYR
jgi:hypothetical protein